MRARYFWHFDKRWFGAYHVYRECTMRLYCTFSFVAFRFICFVRTYACVHVSSIVQKETCRSILNASARNVSIIAECALFWACDFERHTLTCAAYRMLSRLGIVGTGYENSYQRRRADVARGDRRQGRYRYGQRSSIVLLSRIFIWKILFSLRKFLPIADFSRDLPSQWACDRS